MTPEPLPAMLRRLRTSHGWSQARLAAALCEASGHPTVTRNDVSRWERGKRVPRFWLPYLARVFKVPRERLEMATVADTGPDAADTLSSLLPLGNAVAPLSARNGSRVGQSTADDLAARAHGLRLADDVLAGGDLIGPAFRELDAAVRVLRESTHTNAVRRELLRAVGELAQIAGWVASDAADPRTEATYRLGLDAAREAGDGALAAQLAGSLGYHLVNNGRVADGAALSVAAVAEGGPDAPGKTRALFHDRAAWAHTKAGDAQAAMRSLGAAHEALAEDSGDAPEWAYWVNEAELEVMDARVYTELRRPLRAVPLLSRVLRGYPVTSTRERALYESWLAVAYADANEPEEAARVAARVIELSGDVASARASYRVQVVLSRLANYQDVPEVREILAN
ncbi:helix-turn-helix domain-containing protein [Nocardiopsis exhalans]|uniref:Helix-turn-helix domain-containing protein n=1 Tax=Nocardiopsis exhalans TaxID=163604 RepID=A0ABY5D809_9ACTN|nr:helix-turn-helix domain-containing protein [Nocardiopsis exhalans]USY19525.1 helix-turn-helix domain-containing protein [Nocardiopsis exhalans]